MAVAATQPLGFLSQSAQDFIEETLEVWFEAN